MQLFTDHKGESRFRCLCVYVFGGPKSSHIHQTQQNKIIFLLKGSQQNKLKIRKYKYNFIYMCVCLNTSM